MNESPDNLERLISRYLDDEASADERRELKRAVRRDPKSSVLFDELSSLDREFRTAIRREMGRPLVDARPVPVWNRLARTVGIAAAACLAAMLWLHPTQNSASPMDPSHADMGASGASWFAPPPIAADTLTEQPETYVRPQIRFENTDRNWIVIPGDKPGEFLVVEVHRVRSRAVRMQKDF